MNIRRGVCRQDMVEGYEAYYQGLSANDCPYSDPDKREWWQWGYVQAQNEHAGNGERISDEDGLHP